MSTYTQALLEHSESFLPAFAHLRTAQPGTGANYYSPLDFHFDQHGPLPAADETVLGRWLALGSGLITATPSGTPIGVGDNWSGNPVRLFDGPCDVMLTERRLLIYVFDGPTAIGQIGGKAGTVLAVVFPLGKIDYVNVALKSGFRGTKERGLTIATATGTVAVLTLDYVNMVWQDNHFIPFRGTKRADILERLVAPIIAAKQTNAGPADLNHLNNVLAGARINRQAEFGAQFIAE